MGKVFKILGWVLGCSLVLVVLTKDIIIKAIAPGIASSALGASVTLGDFSWNMFSSHLTIKDLRLGSPQGFTDDPILDLARLEVRYSLPSLISGGNHFSLIDMDVRKAVIVRNREGKINVQMLKPAVKEQEKNALRQGKNEEPPVVNLRIDTLKLNIDTLVYKEASGSGYQEQRYNPNMHHRVYSNINSVNDLMIRVVANEVGLSTITNTAFFATHQLKKSVGFITNTAGDVIGGAGGILKKFIPK